MKLAGMEVNALAFPPAGCVGPIVQLQLRVSPLFAKSVDVAPATARELAAMLLQAANLAEGKPA